jgi:hydroxyacylglutathione hydrolase
MKELAPGVHQIGSIAPPFPYAINAYLLGDVLVDALTRYDGKRIVKELSGRAVTAHAITHAHADHQGASDHVCNALGIPFWVPEADVAPAEDPKLIFERQPKHFMAQRLGRLYVGPGHKVDRALQDGDDVAGFKVISTPGHSAGHVVFFRESDRVLVLGDVLCNMDTVTGFPSLTLPKNFFTPDPERNRQSAKGLADLEPALVCFGHGKPLRDTRKFVDFCRAL